MIHVAVMPGALAPSEHYGLDVLVDLSRLLPVDAPIADVTELRVVDPAARCETLRDCVGQGWGIEAGAGVVRVPRAALRAVAAVAGGGVEQRATRRDRFGRVPSEENPLVAAGLEREPVVSRAGALLREAALASAGRRLIRLLPPWPDGHRWAVALTHDLDAVEWWGMFTGLRLLELGGKGQFGRAAAVLAAAGRAIGADPLGDGVRSVLAEVACRDLVATWFVLCGSPTPGTVLAGDLTYRPEAAKTIAALRAIVAHGNEIGLHGSFETDRTPGVFAAQRHRLAGLTGQAVDGVRQHFVKMRPGVTQRAMAGAGFGYDATYGFPDRNGFRLGVADVVPGWDEERNAPANCTEVPLVWMDRALSKYRGIEQPEAWVRDALELAEVSRRHDGLWVGLWHPNLTAALGYPGAPEEFGKLLDQLVAFQPYCATLRDIVAWRGARRSARARAIGPDGRVEAVTRSAHPVRLRLLDAHGESAEEVRVEVPSP